MENINNNNDFNFNNTQTHIEEKNNNSIMDYNLDDYSNNSIMDYDLYDYLKHNFYRGKYYDEKDSLSEDSNVKVLKKKRNREEPNNVESPIFFSSTYFHDIQSMIDFVKTHENLNKDQKDKLENILIAEQINAIALYDSLKLKELLDEDGVIVDKYEEEKMQDIIKKALNSLNAELKKLGLPQYIYISTSTFKNEKNFNLMDSFFKKHTKPYNDKTKRLKRKYIKKNNILNFWHSPTYWFFVSLNNFIKKIENNKILTKNKEKLTENLKNSLYVKLKEIYKTYYNQAKDLYNNFRKQKGILNKNGKILNDDKNKNMEDCLDDALKEINEKLEEYNLFSYKYKPQNKSENSDKTPYFGHSPYGFSFAAPYKFINKIKDSKILTKDKQELTKIQKEKLHKDLKHIYDSYSGKANELYNNLKQNKLLKENGNISENAKNEEIKMRDYLNDALKEINKKLEEYNLHAFIYKPQNKYKNSDKTPYFGHSPYGFSFAAPYKFINKIKDSKILTKDKQELTKIQKEKLHKDLKHIYDSYSGKANELYNNLKQNKLLEENGNISENAKNEEIKMRDYLNDALKEINKKLEEYNLSSYKYKSLNKCKPLNKSENDVNTLKNSGNLYIKKFRQSIHMNFFKALFNLITKIKNNKILTKDREELTEKQKEILCKKLNDIYDEYYNQANELYDDLKQNKLLEENGKILNDDENKKMEDIQNKTSEKINEKLEEYNLHPFIYILKNKCENSYKIPNFSRSPYGSRFQTPYKFIYKNKYIKNNETLLSEKQKKELFEKLQNIYKKYLNYSITLYIYLKSKGLLDENGNISENAKNEETQMQGYLKDISKEINEKMNEYNLPEFVHNLKNKSK